jgi:hypothetical protein
MTRLTSRGRGHANKKMGLHHDKDMLMLCVVGWGWWLTGV